MTLEASLHEGHSKSSQLDTVNNRICTCYFVTSQYSPSNRNVSGPAYFQSPDCTPWAI